MAIDVAYCRSKAQTHRQQAAAEAEERIAEIHREIAEHYDQIVRLNCGTSSFEGDRSDG